MLFFLLVLRCMGPLPILSALHPMFPAIRLLLLPRVGPLPILSALHPMLPAIRLLLLPRAGSLPILSALHPLFPAIRVGCYLTCLALYDGEFERCLMLPYLSCVTLVVVH